MTDAVARFSSAIMNCRRYAASLVHLFHRAMIAHETRRTLDDLPDGLLRDIGVIRSEIPFVAGALASVELYPMPDARGQNAVPRNAETRLLPHAALPFVLAAFVPDPARYTQSRLR